ncbi:M23 family metallopeptidase [Catenuloplanes indicus]
MAGAIIKRLVVAAASLPMIAALGIAVASSGAGVLDPQAAACVITPSDSASTGGSPISLADLTGTQLANAKIIYTVGAERNLPHRAGVIALATAMQESKLYNLAVAVDHDSLGLFQQRPSSGWGTPAQILDPVYATNKFYDKLITIENWQTLPVTVAAQRVQRSAYPDAYAQWEALATDLAASLAAGLGRDTTCAPAVTGEWVRPVNAPVGSGFRTDSRPDHDGVDLSGARGTVIVAASAGTVLVVTCNIVPASHGCNQDGYPGLIGCGWYTDIQHAGGIITRYCHMLTRPNVTAGQHVTAGQPIGLMGSSGNSSGPHLHFEIHLNSDRSSQSAVDPVPFMRSVGVEL